MNLRRIIKIMSTVVLMSVVLLALPVHAEEILTLAIPEGYSSESYSKVYIGGIAKDAAVSSDNLSVSVSLPNTSANTAIMYKYDDSNIPVGMTVWSIDTVTTPNPEGGADIISYEAFKLDNFTDILKYLGFSVRVTGESGLRAKSGIITSVKEMLVSDDGMKGYEGDTSTYHLEEYGQLAMSPGNYESGNYDFIYGGEKVGVARCYYINNVNVVDKLFAQENGRDIFTNALTDIAVEAFDDNYYFRSYIKLMRTDENGGTEPIIIYGPIVGRSMYYVADKLVASPNAASMSKRVSDYLHSVCGAVNYADCTIAFIGDSVMYGCNGANISTRVPENDRLPQYITKLISDEYHNIPVNNISLCSPSNEVQSGGATWSIPGSCSPYNMLFYAKKLKSMGSNPDVIVVMAGLNDWGWQNQGHGSNGGTSRFGVLDSDGCLILDSDWESSNGTTKTRYTYNTGGFESSYEYDASDLTTINESVKYDTGLHDYKLDNNYSYGIFRTIAYLTDTTNFPNSPKIIICTPNQAVMYGQSGTSHNNGTTFENLRGYANQQKRIANYFKNNGKDVSVIDVYNGWSVKEGSSNFWSLLPDGTHPNAAGYHSMGDYIYSQMKTILDQ